MRLHILFIIVSCALGARARSAAAGLPPAPVSQAVPDLQKKLTEVAKEVLKDDKPIDNRPSEQELIGQANTVIDIENNLRNVQKNDKIPVKVVTEDVKDSITKNFGIEKGLDVIPIDDANVKRAEIDLKNPGPPQRQEHDTQSPEDSNFEQDAITSIKQGIISTQENLKKGFEVIKEELKAVIPSDKQVHSIQQGIVSLQKSFTEQISQLNNTLIAHLPNEDQVSIDNVEKDLEVVKKDFDSGVTKLSKGLLSFASGKQDQAAGTDTSSTSSGSGGNIFQTFQQNMVNLQQQFQQQMQNQFNTLQQNFQNLVSQVQQGGGSNAVGAGPGSIIQSLGGTQNIVGQENVNKPSAAGAQSDTPASPERPSIGQGIQNFFQGLWNRPGSAPAATATQTEQNVQADTPVAATTQPGPIVQAIQGNPLYQGVVNLIQRPQANGNKPAQNAPAKPVEVAPNQEGANSVPVEKPAEESNPVTEEKKPAATGPIQQLVQRNPIVQGIAGVAQRIQHTVANPEKPRENERGHWYGGHGGGSASGNSDVSNSGIASGKSEPVKEEEKKKCQKQNEESLPQKEETLPQKDESISQKEESLPQKETEEIKENNAVFTKSE